MPLDLIPEFLPARNRVEKSLHQTVCTPEYQRVRRDLSPGFQIRFIQITGDGPKNLLLAPLWTGNKRLVLNAITRYFKEEQVQQGELFPAD